MGSCRGVYLENAVPTTGFSRRWRSIVLSDYIPAF
jgi:hypothetical protein